MIARLLPNRVRRTYLGGGRIDAFCGMPETPCPEDWLASTVPAFNGTEEIEGEGLGRLEDGRLVREAVGALPILVKLLDSDERLVVQAHPTVPCARRLFHSPVGKTECWYVLPGTAPDACVHLGFKPGITRSAWENAVTSHAGAGDVGPAPLHAASRKGPVLHADGHGREIFVLVVSQVNGASLVVNDHFGV